jgi:hypothetical protein
MPTWHSVKTSGCGPFIPYRSVAGMWQILRLEQLQENYGHHHLDFQEEAAEAFARRR